MEEKKINLKAVAVTAIDGKEQKVDFSKEIGNGIYFGTRDIDVADKARELYKHGEVTADERFIGEVKQFVERKYGVVVRTAIEKCL